MPSKCCVVNCSKRGDRDDGIHFFRFPALLSKPKQLAELSKNRRNSWLTAIKRTDLASTALKYTRICSQHFVTGTPARLKDTLCVDWIPTVKMGSKPFNKRLRLDNNNKSPTTNQNQSNRLKSRGALQTISELEQLKLEIRSKDELIKNYKVEKVQREQNQMKVVSNYEQRLKEKDIKIEKGIRQLRNKSISSEKRHTEQEGSGVTMRVGRKLKKTIVEQKSTKPCFVRLEKVQKEKGETKESTPPNRKLTGPLKKRPLNTPSQIVRKVQPPTTVASTRARRAPKPNPKYSNADIITPKSKAKRSKGLHEFDDGSIGESDSADDYYNDLEQSSNGSETYDGDAGDAFEVDESSDFSENEELHPKAKRPLRNAVSGVGTTPPVAKRGRPKKILPTPRAKPVEPKKSNQAPLMPQRTTMLTGSQQLQQAKKRKLEADDEDEPIIESIIARNKRLNIALYDANVAKPLQSIKNATSKSVNTVGITRTQSPASPLTQKKIMHPIRSAVSVSKESLKEKSKSPLQRRLPATASKSSDVADSASTQDDFETMPTFTIVNIHDIINKKGDCLVQKNPDETMGTTSPNTTNRINRRKTGHTTILSEKLDPGKQRTPVHRTPFPPKKISSIFNSNTTARAESRVPTRVSLSLPERKAVTVEKPAPRILNSVVAKRTYPVQPILGKLDNDIELEATKDTIEKTQMVKENVGSNKVFPLKPSQPRKLPPEKVFVQRQGNKLIKKITCFETWYVINIPETQEPIIKNSLEIPLITLSNSIKSIRLPSASWSTKVTLYKLSTQMMSKSSLTPYTGDLSDQSIPEEDREKYQPSCVMFRRMTQQKSRTRMPYDRAVIFKMKTFFTNIDGKNVRLIGAPNTITSFEEIEVLLELVDELDLLHELVEPANTV